MNRTSTQIDSSHVGDATSKMVGRWGFRAHWLLVFLISIPMLASLFWWLGQRYFHSQLNFLEYQQYMVLVAAVVTGGYQLYFWVERNNTHITARCLKISADDRVPFRPQYIWLYSFLYYLMIGLTVISIQDLAEGVHIIFGGILLLVTGCVIFYFVPTYVPGSYRQFEVNSTSTRFLAFVQSMDNDRNAFPSMHCALAAYVGLVVIDLPIIGPWIGYGYIVVIVISSLLVKQHVIADTLAGVALGSGIFYLNEWLPGWLEYPVY